MPTVLESSKTKIARRVIEVFEFFDNNSRPAAVMDIVRCYGRPQSSTSELLNSLVELGLLYKDTRLRTYRPTPRLATLGSSVQPAIVRDGRLFGFMDRLARSSRHSVALFGRVGTHVQIFRWSGACPSDGIGSGSSEWLSTSAAGQLLLSTLSSGELSKILRRLNAEAVEEEKFNHSAMVERIMRMQRQGHATGDAGFAPDMHVTAVLLPTDLQDRPLAIGMIYPSTAVIDASALVATFRSGIGQCQSEARSDISAPPSLMRAV